MIFKLLPREKDNWAAAQQNQQNGMWAQQWVFTVRSMGSFGPKVSSSNSEDWSDRADA